MINGFHRGQCGNLFFINYNFVSVVVGIYIHLLFLIDLEKLHLTECQISDSTVQNYLKLPNLRLLSLNDCQVSFFFFNLLSVDMARNIGEFVLSSLFVCERNCINIIKAISLTVNMFPETH